MHGSQASKHTAQVIKNGLSRLWNQASESMQGRTASSTIRSLKESETKGRVDVDQRQGMQFLALLCTCLLLIGVCCSCLARGRSHAEGEWSGDPEPRSISPQ